MISTEFLLTALVVVLVPGTGVVYTVSTGLLQGGRASLAAAAGCTLGIVPHLAASSLGLSAILHYSAVVFQLLKYAGALYLLFVAWSMWREAGAIDVQGGSRPHRHGYLKTALRGVTLNILNPKLSIFFLAFLPLFVRPGGPAPLVQMLTLSLIFMAMTLVVFVLYGLCAHGARSAVLSAPLRMRRIQRGCAALLAGLGIKLALAEA